MNSNAKIIVLAYPDTFVSVSDEFICKFLPYLGLGTKEYIKAGHAALVLIENKTGKARYFDFGRYVTPASHGRVRGENTDAELEIPIKAEITKEGVLKNLDSFLLWLDANPLKTHGEGRLLASVCDAINFEKAENFILSLQNRGSIPYGAFDKNSSNCSRFVTDTILAATEEEMIIKALRFNKKFTPSTVGNVEKAATERKVYEVYDGAIQPFLGSAFKENITNYFHRKKRNNSQISNDAKNGLTTGKLPVEAQKLSGTGSNAWFHLLHENLPKNHFRIKRYNDDHEVDFDGVYISEVFEATEPYTFTYDSNCAYCHVIQKEKKIRLERIATFQAFNSLKKEHSA